jgi:hypothetical protein
VENYVSPRLPNNNVEGNPYRIRDPRNSSLTEIWLVSAVVSVLLIRLYLRLTGYPQVGGDTLHIAHMLWGGLGMVIAFGMLLIFADDVWKPVAALVGGIGFGTFIDELGKFITKDNDYFYQPTIALMYGIFIFFYWLSRYFDRKRTPTEADHLYLAVQGIQWQAIGKLDKRRQEEALGHLKLSGNTSPFAQGIRDILEQAELIETANRSPILATREKAAALYWRFVGQKWIQWVVVALFAQRALSVVVVLGIGAVTGSFRVTDGLSVSEWLAFGSGMASGALALYGLIRMVQRRRVQALQALAGSAIVSLLFGQFFAFASVQFVALIGLVADLGVLGALRLALAAEHERFQHEDGYVAENPRRGLGRFL